MPGSRIRFAALAALTLARCDGMVVQADASTDSRRTDVVSEITSDAAHDVLPDQPRDVPTSMDRVDVPVPVDVPVQADRVIPPPPDSGSARPLPDISSVTVNCSAATVSNLTTAEQIYDTYLGNALPTSDAAFGWHTDPALASTDIALREQTWAVPTGQTTATYHALFDFNPTRFARNTSLPNYAIFGTFSPMANREAPYRQFNPYDYLPVSATHYGRTSSSDVLATQFVYRVACFRSQMARVFQVCPDCVDGIVPLSGNDIYQIFGVRFVRVRSGQLEVTREFRTFSIDSGGNNAYFTDDMYRYRFAAVSSSNVLFEFRRIEISGRMAQNLGTYGGPTGVLIRLDPASAYP